MDTVPVRIVRLRWAVRAVLALGIIASVAANILAAQPHPISRTIAAWPPLALLLTVELLSRIPVHRRGLASVRILATATIAGIAAWVSYWHMVDVALAYGETGVSAYLLPASVDGLIVVASICLLELGGRSAEPTVQPVDEPAQPSTPDEPSATVVDEPAPVRPVHVVAASTPARRRTTTATVRRTRAGQVDVDTVRRLLAGTLPANRDELAAAVRAAGLSVSNARAGELLRELRTATAAA